MEQEEITGTIDRFLFQSAENGFTVFVLHTRGTNTVTARGHLPNAQPGQHVNLRGAWVHHPKFGKQFNVATCTLIEPTTTEGLKKYLGSGMIKGIGKVYAEKLVNHFDTDVLRIIDEEPKRLSTVPGIGKKRAEQIVAGWEQQKDVSSIMLFLQEHGVSPAYASKIYKQYRHEAIAVLKENPYRLAEEIWGVGFKMADAIAQTLGFARTSVNRAKAGICFLIGQAVSNGHLYCVVDELKKQTFELLELDAQEHELVVKQALYALHEQEKLRLISHNEKHYVTLARYYFSEFGVSRRILELLKRPACLPINANAVYEKLRNTQQSKIALNEDQQRGIMAALQNKITIITGGPGTGKTTLIRALLDVLDAHHVSYKLAAPTGRAAKRMYEGTGRHAETLHRLLSFDMGSMGFAHNERNALKLDVLIVDEASMIDIFLANAILKALPLDAHLILIGDTDQLPSVGAGNVLHDLIASEIIATVRLTHIFRQAQNSLIVVNAHRVNTGEFPSARTENPLAKKDFIYFKEEIPENTMAHITHIFAQVLPKHGIAPSDAMLLSPMNRGNAGTFQLNHAVQQLVNPATDGPALAVGGYTFRVGDRVMQIRNNYDKNIFNGDIGGVESVDQAERKLTVLFGKQSIEYESSELDELVLAYAISIHKSQGSEYPAVIVPLFTQHFMLLQRNLVYTAITRAQKLCILIGQARAIAMAVKNNKGSGRVTFLKAFLTTDLTCR